MFDLGFAEILLIAVIGLIVIGPKRMPEAVRFMGYWLGRLRRGVQNARRDMEREFGLDEIRRDLHNESLLNQLEQERNDVARLLETKQDSEDDSSNDPDSGNATSRPDEQEMLQAFDDFDREFPDTDPPPPTNAERDESQTREDAEIETLEDASDKASPGNQHNVGDKSK